MELKREKRNGCCYVKLEKKSREVAYKTFLFLDIFALSIQHCRHVRGHWSGVFNLLWFDHAQKHTTKYKIVRPCPRVAPVAFAASATKRIRCCTALHYLPSAYRKSDLDL